ncbi:MAG: SIMPL domain-containing protein [Rhodospirillales bacterium]|nr:SIMPL domain-containing protein [Alphaproteobacteria bacterium]USO04739.1 MAG: SIMPL domain-containing protein [Rhodospirillales bacterium]
MRVILILALAAVFSFPQTVAAQCGASPAPDLPDGHLMMNFSATERRDVEQDLLVTTLSYSATNRDVRALQNEVNSTMKKALERVKREKEVEAQTGAYQVYETSDPHTKERLWRGSQNITLKSKNADDLLALSGDLQDMKLATHGLSYTLDPETAASVKDSLMEAALIQLQQRADRAAKALGKSSASLREVTIVNEDASYSNLQMYERSMVADDAAMDMAVPVAQAGETTISLSVSATAVLKP